MSSTGVQPRHSGDEEQPLLRRHRRRTIPSINLEHWASHPFRGEQWTVQNTRHKARQLLSSRFGHYSVLTLVSLDVLSMIADFILKLFKCEQGDNGTNWELGETILDIVSLSFSCLFMVELMTSVWAFGWSYFKSWFHCFDALIVIASFVTDVVLHGVIGGASFIVALRLWRVVQIIEELSVGAQERTEGFEHEIEELKRDLDHLRDESSQLKEELDKAGMRSEGSNTQATQK